MSTFQVVNGHRVFDAGDLDSCVLGGHRPGDRHHTPGLLDSEWTGEVWTSVCPDCDLPMLGRDEHGWSICEGCRRTHRGLSERARREVA